MKNQILSRRRSGILAHISSLPSPYGIGDIGTSGYSFLHFLAESGQSCWQFLPLNPTNSIFDHSPYMSSSAFAGSPLFISPDLLVEDGLIDRGDLITDEEFSPYMVNFPAVERYKKTLLEKAFKTFSSSNQADYQSYLDDHPWLDDHALFMALKDAHNDTPWFSWEPELRFRDEKTLDQAREKYQTQIEYYRFEQYLFSNQWSRLKEKAEELGILLFGDIPIYVGLDSVDVWAHQSIFELDPETNLPISVAGVPPDYFSETGQRWGNPLYRWGPPESSTQARLVEWWSERFSAIFRLVDKARIDHFRAFDSYWAIPAEEETAIGGEWRPGPGLTFFEAIEKKLGKLDIVAEDLGIITESVIELRDALGFPGMKVLQFAFDGNPENSFLPHNFDTPHCVVYTGTHDNDTSVGWYLSERLDDVTRKRVKRYANRHDLDGSQIHHDLIYLAMSSISELAIVPLQDVLGFGNDCKMNSPGIPEGNWRWRCSEEFLTNSVQDELLEVTKLFHRFHHELQP